MQTMLIFVLNVQDKMEIYRGLMTVFKYNIKYNAYHIYYNVLRKIFAPHDAR